MYDDVTPFSRCLQVQAFDPPPYFRSSSVFARALLCFGAALSAEEEKAIEADLCNSHPMVALGMKLTYGNACTVCCLHVRTVKTQFPQTTQASVSVQTKRSCSDLFQKSTERKCRLVQKTSRQTYSRKGASARRHCRISNTPPTHSRHGD